MIQFSSGTTVDPKPVALTHRAVMAQVVALNSYWPDTDRVRHSGVSWLPLYHDMGLIGCLFTALERPGDLTLIPPELFVSRPAIWLRTLSVTRATISPAPNFGYGLCVEKIRDEDLAGADLSNWRVALNGAETVVADVARSFSRRFSRFGFQPQAMTPVYGLSEAALAVTFSDLDRPFTSRRVSRVDLSRGRITREDPDGVEIVSVGRPLPGLELSIRDADGASVGDGEIGGIRVRGDALMSGYFGNQAATAQVLDGEWLDTGDLGFLHERNLYVTGRAKDILILRGRNHLPDDVERALDDVEGVRTGCSAAVSFLPENGCGEILMVLVEHSRGLAETDRSELAERCRRAILARTGLEAGLVEILEPGTLPRTSSGKIRRQEALARYLEGRLTPPDRVSPARLLAAMARSRAALRRSNRAAAREES